MRRPAQMSRIATAFAIVAATGVLSPAQQPGQSLFQSNCAGCHGLDARGGEHAPNIATQQRVQQRTDAELARIVRDGIPAAGMPAFGSRFNAEQLSNVVGYLRVLQGEKKTVSLPGNPGAGHGVFFDKAGCSECHMVAGKGGFIAGDLSSYAAAHSIGEIRDAILEPNNNLDPHHAWVTVITKNGRHYTGIIRNEDSSSMQLQTRDGAFQLFEKATLAGITHEKNALMPADYGSRLSASEINDLISYLIQTASKQPKQSEDDSEW